MFSGAWSLRKKKCNNVRCHKTLRLAEERCQAVALREQQWWAKHRAGLNLNSCAYTKLCVLCQTGSIRMLNFLFFLYLNPWIFLHIPSRNNNIDFDYLKNKKLSLNLCWPMWTAENYLFSLINWHWHFIYCMWFQYCFPLSFFPVGMAKSGTFTQLLSHLLVEIYSFWSWGGLREREKESGCHWEITSLWELLWASVPNQSCPTCEPCVRLWSKPAAG